MTAPLSPIAVLALAAALAMFAPGCGGASDEIGGGADSGSGSTQLALVAYSTPQVVYDVVNPAFRRTVAGRDVGFRTSFGASGDQSRAVAAGLPADIVSFSIQPDMERLVKAGLVADDWRSHAAHGLVSTSVVTFVVRRGNPKRIRSWADLLRPGVRVLTPNPFTSGSAKWNLLAAYGQASREGRDPRAGLAYVSKLLKEHVKVQDKSAREALQGFVSGNGDVLLSYENEAVTAQKKGQAVDYIVPRSTIRIEIPIAVTKTSKAPAAAAAYLDYLLSPPAQQVFADWGYRPVNATVLKANASRFPDPPQLFTVDQLGGWTKLNADLFDPADGAIAKIENGLGVSASK